MGSFAKWLATTPLGTALKAALGVALSLILTEISSGGIDFAHWSVWAYAALGAALPVVINWANSSDSRYGRKRPTATASTHGGE
jgi:hypothetical protein